MPPISFSIHLAAIKPTPIPEVLEGVPLGDIYASGPILAWVCASMCGCNGSAKLATHNMSREELRVMFDAAIEAAAAELRDALRAKAEAGRLAAEAMEAMESPELTAG